MARGRLIVLEGGEGSGKTTQAGLLAASLGAVLTREPGGTATGEAIRALVLDRSLGGVAARTELLLMVAARAQHVAEVIAPALEAGRDVVSDRFSGSTLAYQAYGRGLPIGEVRAACDLATDGLSADLNIYLEVPEAVLAGRRPAVADRIEAAGKAFHRRVLAGFSELARSEAGWAVVDGVGTPEEVARRVAAAVAGRLGEAVRR